MSLFRPHARAKFRFACATTNARTAIRFDVSVNGSVIFSGELFNAWNCQNVPVQQGTNRFELFAINGTGFKGNCSHTDANTGEIVVTGGNTRGTQSWRHRGGAGSQANLNVTVGPAGGTCTPTGSEPGSNTGPGTGTRLYGAVANAFHSQCQGRATGMSSGHSDLASAESRALQECQSRRSSGLPGCTVIARFGSAYQGNHQCAAVAYGERTSGNVTSCKLRCGNRQYRIGSTIGCAVQLSVRRIQLFSGTLRHRRVALGLRPIKSFAPSAKPAKKLSRPVA